MRRFSGGLRSALIIGLQGIRSRKLRTLLAMTSLFLGVLAVVVVQAAAETARRAAVADVELQAGKDGTRRLYLPMGADVMSAVVQVVQGRSDAVLVTNMHGVIGEPGVRALNPGGGPLDMQRGRWGGDGSTGYVCYSNGACREAFPGAGDPPGQAVELTVFALSGDIIPFRPYRLRSGQWLDFRSEPSFSPGLVLNEPAAEALRRYPIPAQLHIPGTKADPTPRILGVVDDGQVQPIAYLRLDELSNWLPVSGWSSPEAQMGGTELLLSPQATALERVLRSRINALDSSATLQIETINSRKQAADQLAVIRWVFLGVASVVLLIGVAGILNVGLATVGERVEEFALRRAVGTHRLLLAGIVLAETLLTGLFTAGVAIAVGAAGVKVVSRVLGEQHVFLGHLEFPWQAGVAGVIAGLVAGVLGGLIPAIRAARIPIATVMRA